METMKIKRCNIHSLADIKSKSSKDFQQLGSRFEQSFKYKTKKELEEEKKYIDIASTIDNIQELLLDIYK